MLYFHFRLQGITKSISRYPTFKRKFENLVKDISEELAKKNYNGEGSIKPPRIPRSKSAFARILSQKSLRSKTSNNVESQVVLRDVQIE